MKKSSKITDYLIKLTEEIGPRRAGTKACKRAAEFINAVYAACGYNTFFFDIPFVCWEADGAEITIDDRTITGYANVYSPSGIGEGEVIVLRSIYELEEAKIQGKVCIFTDKLTGKVLYLGDTPFQSGRDEQIQALLEQQVPAAIITINPNPGSVLPYMEKYMGAPSLTVTNEFKQEVLQMEKRYVQVSVSSHSEDTLTGNVIARTKDAGRKIVVSAHYDTVEGSPGAWDNGSGVSVLLELAQRFKGKDLAIQIEFAAMCPHETGYPGSITYTDTVQAELEKVILNINIDGIGAVGGIDTITSDCIPAWLFRMIQTKLQRYAEIKEKGDIQTEGDHFAYTWNDIPAILFTSSVQAGMHHENTDNLNHIDTERIERIADFIEELIDEISVHKF